MYLVKIRHFSAQNLSDSPIGIYFMTNCIIITSLNALDDEIDSVKLKNKMK